MSRSFTVVKVADIHGKEKGEENLGGVFHGKTPVSAAKKAMTKICRNSYIKGQCTLIVSVRETTRGSANKVFTYKVKRIKNPSQVTHGNVQIVHNYEVHASAVKQ